MTQINRLALNTVVSYSRSLLALLLGLFSARWVLQALGQEDFGLYGVVGSLLVSISFLNVSLSGSVSRFYAFSIGAATTLRKDEAEDDLRGWFNAALLIHLVLGFLLIAIGWPVGEYTIHHILSVPGNRIEACAWVLRFSVFSSVVGILVVPYCAFYTAYQFIAELTVFEIIRTILNFVGAYVLLHVSSDRLVFYSLMMSAIGVMVSFAQLWRAQYQFPTRMALRYFHFDLSRIKAVLRYGVLKLMGVLGWLFKAHGSALVINLSFSPRENAAYSIANQVVVHSTALAMSMVNAIAPALTTFSGAGKLDKMRSYATRTCKMSGFLVMFFAVPLICEMDYVLNLWLTEPPAYSVELCRLFLIAFFIDNISVGCMSAISTKTEIGGWQLAESIILAINVPILFACYRNAMPFMVIGYVFIFISVLIVCERLYFARRLIDMSPRTWIKDVLLPVCSIAIIGFIFGSVVKGTLNETFLRLIIVSSVTTLTMMVPFFLFGMDNAEKQLVVQLLKKFTNRL